MIVCPDIFVVRVGTGGVLARGRRLQAVEDVSLFPDKWFIVYQR